jgi:S-adenosylmethionine decarboxylase
MGEYDFSGTHVMADIYDIPDRAINNEALILNCLTTGITLSGATICGMQTKRFEPTGLTAIYLLSESHVSVHTYPDQNSLFFDAFTCGSRCKPEEIVHALVEGLGPCRHETKIVRRGYHASQLALNLALARR